MLDDGNLVEPRQNSCSERDMLAKMLARSPVLENMTYATMILNTYARVAVRRADAFGR